MNQGAGKKRWGVKFYALTISVFVHVVALSVFAAVKLAQPKAEPANAPAVVSIAQVAALAQRDTVIPKPKISEPVKSRPFENSAKPAANAARGIPIIKTSSQERPVNTQPLMDLPKQDYGQSKQTDEPAEQPAGAELLPAKGSETSRPGTEFFGSASVGRRICYVVDCSGSMQGVWRQVCDELADSISRLQQDQYFCVIVFGGGSILESGGGKMVRASQQARKEAGDFIKSIKPRGTTNATTALEHAVKIRDGSGVAPSLIYFLTDGFELSEQDGYKFAHQVATMLRSFSPKTKINTIGFWPEEQDRKILEIIAKETGGEFVAVGDSAGQKTKDN
jgi:hypothetical protein